MARHLAICHLIIKKQNKTKNHEQVYVLFTSKETEAGRKRTLCKVTAWQWPGRVLNRLTPKSFFSALQLSHLSNILKPKFVFLSSPTLVLLLRIPFCWKDDSIHFVSKTTPWCGEGRCRRVDGGVPACPCNPSGGQPLLSTHCPVLLQPFQILQWDYCCSRLLEPAPSRLSVKNC